MVVFGGSDNSGQRAQESSRLFKPQKLVLTRIAKGVDGLKEGSYEYSGTKFKSQFPVPGLRLSTYAPSLTPSSPFSL